MLNTPSPKYALLLLNLGTPDSPSTPDVRRYLSEFLNDARVIDVPWLVRKVLVNGVIVPFRAPRSAKLYREIWTDRGSPLLFHGQDLREAVEAEMGPEWAVEFAMRYRNPRMRDALERIRLMNVERLVVLPLYPQYASSTTGSTLEALMKELEHWPTLPALQFITDFYRNPDYLDCVAQTGRKFDLSDYDHILFSFHGIPERHIRKGDCQSHCLKDTCCAAIGPKNHHCYRAGCFETARQVAFRLGLRQEDYTVSFQSRLGRDPWIKPYTDHELESLAKAGKKRVLVFSPAFVADCLETVHEIGVEYQEEFEKWGGTKVQLVPSLNSEPAWVKTVANMARTATS